MLSAARQRERRGRPRRRRHRPAASSSSATEEAPVVKLVNAHPDRRHPQARERRPRRAVREDAARALPRRRRALRGDAAAAASCKNAITSRMKIMAQLDIAERRLPQDGRIKLKLGRGKEMDFRVSVLPDAVRREGRAPPPRQVEPAARHDQARLRGRAARRTSRTRSTSPTAWCSSPGPTGSRQDDDALLGARRAQQDRRRTSRPPRIPIEFNLAGINQVQMHDEIGPQLRRGAARLPAPGPRHHHGRRDPRLRDGGDRASRPRSPATWCSRRSTPTTRRRPSTGCSTWASSRSSSRAPST